MIFLDAESMFLPVYLRSLFFVDVHSHAPVGLVIILIQQPHKRQQHIHVRILYTGLIVTFDIFKKALRELISGICRPCKPIDCQLLVLRNFTTEQIQFAESVSRCTQLFCGIL